MGGCLPLFAGRRCPAPAQRGGAGAYSLNAVERILAVQAQPKSVLDTLADQERGRLPPHLSDNPVSPRPTTDYQYLVEPATDHEPPKQTSPDAVEADTDKPPDASDGPA